LFDQLNFIIADSMRAPDPGQQSGHQTGRPRRLTAVGLQAGTLDSWMISDRWEMLRAMPACP